MFRIRRIDNWTTPGSKQAVTKVQEMIRDHFENESEYIILSIPSSLHDPIIRKYRSIIFIAEGSQDNVQGAAILLHFPDHRFCFLDYIFSSKGKLGRGVGSALYERARYEARSLNCIGIFLECLQETVQAEPDPSIRKENVARLKFYERYGARPIMNTKYETPLIAEDLNPPYLVYDDLSQDRRLRKKEARGIVRAILERKYKGLCPPDYVELVVGSFMDDPVRLREPKYTREDKFISVGSSIPQDRLIPLIINDKHEIHHVHERGYVESPVRIRSIIKGLEDSGLFERVAVERYRESEVLAVHDRRYVDYFKKVCSNLPPGKSVYPYVFPIRNRTKPPRELLMRAGYFCIDTFTPLNKNAYLAARRAVDCALTGADRILKGEMISYALVRPPGHHAGKDYFGGFCYFNSNAIAANRLSREGKVAILDIDYHHGNGQQDIFYERSDVLTISIHGHPSFAYPYFTGFKDERGIGDGLGHNWNIPLPERASGDDHFRALEVALDHIRKFDPDFLVVAFGMDTAKGDPTGTWDLLVKDFERNGRLIGSMKVPILVVQEGGYRNRILGGNAKHFFRGIFKGTYTSGNASMVVQ
ncbi:MAG: acetylpolyamine amidohydrolase [Thermoplasmatota archaeon]